MAYEQDDFTSDYDISECSCQCWECMHERHRTCTGARLCAIAATCEDCGRQECVCGQEDPREEESTSPYADLSVEQIVERMKGLKL